jgi:hypothetical protein
MERLLHAGKRRHVLPLLGSHRPESKAPAAVSFNLLSSTSGKNKLVEAVTLCRCPMLEMSAEEGRTLAAD